MQSSKSADVCSRICQLLAIATALVPGVLVAEQTQLPPTPPATITVDLAKRLGAYKPIYSWFGYDEANYTTTPGGTRLLRELHDLSPVPVNIRVHHLLTSGDGKAELKFSSTNVYREDASGKAMYDFRILDGIFDTFKDTGVRPMVELGFMPKDLAATLSDGPVTYQIHYPKSTVSGASNNPPKDYAKWANLSAWSHSILWSATDEIPWRNGTSRSGTSRTSTTGTEAKKTTSSCTTSPLPAFAPRCRVRRSEVSDHGAGGGPGARLPQDVSRSCIDRKERCRWPGSSN